MKAGWKGRDYGIESMSQNFGPEKPWLRPPGLMCGEVKLQSIISVAAMLKTLPDLKHIALV